MLIVDTLPASGVKSEEYKVDLNDTDFPASATKFLSVPISLKTWVFSLCLKKKV